MKIKEALARQLQAAQQNGQLNLSDFFQAMEPAFTANGYRQKPKGSVQQVLVIRLDAIGDNVLNSGFLRELRRSCPKAQITLVVDPVVYNLVELCPYVNEILVYPGASKGNFVERYTWAMELCEEKLWQRHFDLCICPRWDFDKYFALFLGYMSGARERAGYSEKLYAGKAKVNEGYDNFLTKAVMNPPELLHEAERNFFLLKAIGLRVEDTSAEVWYDEADCLLADRWLGKDIVREKSGIAIVLGANEPCRIYPVEYYCEALRAIYASGDCFVLLGGKNDMQSAEFLTMQLKSERIMVKNLVGKTTLRESCAVMSSMKLYIGNETGLTHIAAALQIPVIELQREAMDCKKTIISAVLRFAPWQTMAILLRPRHAKGECAKVLSHGGCIADKAHCIKQILPKEIVQAYYSLTQILYRR